MNMMQLAREQAESLILRAWKNAAADGALPGSIPGLPTVELPADTTHGDLSSAFCLAVAGSIGMSPRALADTLLRHAGDRGNCLSAVEAAGPGYLNFRLSDKWYADALRSVAETAMRRDRSVEWIAPLPPIEGSDWAVVLRRRFLGQALANILDRTGDAFVCIADENHYVNPQEFSAGSCRVLRNGALADEAPSPADLPLDALRFFFSIRLDRPVTVDLDLAAREDRANPYYRVRYTRDRIARVLRRLAAEGQALPCPADTDLSVLDDGEERALIRLLCRWEDTVGLAARTADPGVISACLTELADRFWPQRRTLLSPDGVAAPARLLLSDTVRMVLEDGLFLLGISF